MEGIGFDGKGKERLSTGEGPVAYGESSGSHR